MTLIWSEYQQNIFKAITPQHNMIIEAVAGSGKTTTIVEIVQLLKKRRLVSGNNGSGLVCAFNKHIEITLSQKIKGTKFQSKTLNAIGHGILTRRSYPHKVSIENKKYYQICAELENYFTPSHLRSLGLKELVNHEFKNINNALQRLKWRKKPDYPYVFDEFIDFVEVVNTCRKEYSKHNLSINDLVNLMSEYPLEISSYLVDKEVHLSVALQAINKALYYGIRAYLDQNIIDFTDQLWLPLTLGFTPVKKYDWIIVDESQDLNLNQARLIKTLGCPGSTYIFVGDSQQSIYLFNGAKPDCMSLLKKYFNCTEYPLSLCYRCPPNHLELVKKYNPNIQAFKQENGLIKDLNKTEVRELVKHCYQNQIEIILISRLNYIFFDLLCMVGFEDKVKVSLLGADLGKELIKLARKILANVNLKKSAEVSETLKEYVEYYSNQMDSTRADYCKCLLTIWQYVKPTSFTELSTQLSSIIIADGVIKFGSIHRAKGTEAEHVVILGDNLLPYSPTNRKLTAIEIEQEKHLTYVARTRSKENLYLVEQITTSNEDEDDLILTVDSSNDYLIDDIDYGF
jgi:hypothetical protein